MPLDAVVVVDKPLGLTSFDVVARVRRALGERRVGHAGTLDPLATGVLVVCLGAATKAVPYLMAADKLYRATARLGVATDTDDADPKARVLYRADAAALLALRSEQVAAELLAMVGDLSQRPPRFSALKHEGQPLYVRARRERQSDADEDDSELERQLVAKQRQVRIDAIEIEGIDLSGDAPSVTFTVRCGKGTYIRSIARDLGDALGVGAHLTALRRLRVGPFDESAAVAPTPEALPTARCFSLTEALAHLPQARVEAPLAQRLRQGQVTALAELRDAFGPVLPPPVAAVAEADASPLSALTVIDPAGALVAIVDRGQANQSWRIARGF